LWPQPGRRCAHCGAKRSGPRARAPADGPHVRSRAAPMRTDRVMPKHCASGLVRTASAFIVVAALTVAGSAQDFLAPPGAPAAAFPKPDRPVADIVSPIWHSETERDEAGEPRQVVRLLGIKSGMTVADIGAGSGYYVTRLSPVVGPTGRV